MTDHRDGRAVNANVAVGCVLIVCAVMTGASVGYLAGNEFGTHWDIAGLIVGLVLGVAAPLATVGCALLPLWGAIPAMLASCAGSVMLGLTSHEAMRQRPYAFDAPSSVSQYLMAFTLPVVVCVVATFLLVAKIAGASMTLTVDLRSRTEDARSDDA